MNDIRVGLACIALASVARAQCFDWSDEFVSSGLSGGTVSAQIVFDDGSGPALFLGGNFASIAGVRANGLAKWNGAQWTTFGDGVAPGTGTFGVRAFAIFDDGSGPALFVGGGFAGIDGVSASNIAKWDGVSWSALGSGTNAVVHALCVFDDGSGPALFAGGEFTQAGGAAADRLAKWNGASWSAVPTGFGPTYMGPSVRALAVYDDGSGPKLYAGGIFSAVAGVQVNHIAKWNGASWASLNFGVSSTLGVYSLAVYDEGFGPSLFLAGAFDYNNGGGQNIARWDGGPFLTAVGNTSANATNGIRLGGVTSLVVFDDGSGAKLHAAGERTSSGNSPVRAWNGTTWSNGGSALSLGQYDLGIVRADSLGVFDDGSGAQLFAAGRFVNAGSVVLNGLGSWDGASWSAYGTNATVNRQVRALATFDDGSGENLYVAGDFVQAGASAAYSVARFDGQAWAPLAPGGSPNQPIHALAVFDDGGGDKLYAAGEFVNIAGVGANGVARWNGSSWSSLGAGLGLGFDQWANALAVYDDGAGAALYVAGRFTHAGGMNNVKRIAKWNGSAWSKLGAGLSSEAYALCVYDDGSGAQLFVGGDFATAGPGVGAHIASWDGATWNDVGGGTGANVYALAVFDDGAGPALYAGGTFNLAGGVNASKLARWNGTSWSDVGGGVNAMVESLAVFDDGAGPALYVAGASITSAGGVPVLGIARWNGSQWSAVGGGVLGFALNAMTTFDDGTGDALFVGGDLLLASEHSSVNLAKWSRACSCPPVSYCTAGTTTNGCNAHISGIGAPSASSGSGFDLVVSDVEGQKTGLIFYGISGAKSDPWGAGSSFVCVKVPQQRTGNQFSNGTAGACDGVLALDFNAYLASHPGALGSPFSAITSVWAQAWFRDPPAPKGTNLSDATRFDVCP